MFSMCGGVNERHMSSAESCCGGDKKWSLSIQNTHRHFYSVFKCFKGHGSGLVTNTETWTMTIDLWWPASFFTAACETHLPQVGHYRSICPWMFCIQPILSILIHHNRKWLVKPPKRKRTEMKQCPWHAKFLKNKLCCSPTCRSIFREGGIWHSGPSSQRGLPPSCLLPDHLVWQRMLLSQCSPMIAC